MLKKVFSLLIALFLLLFTSNVFAANNEMGDSMNKAGNTVRNVVGGTENVVEDAAGAIGTGIKDLGNTVSNGAANITNNGNNSNVGYNASRTATTGSTTNNGFLGMNSNTWTWLILAIVAIAIVGLVWYYVAQNNKEYNNNNH